MYEFGYPSKVIPLIESCANVIKFQIKVDDKLFEDIRVVTVFQQGDDKSCRRVMRLKRSQAVDFRRSRTFLINNQSDQRNRFLSKPITTKSPESIVNKFKLTKFNVNRRKAYSTIVVLYRIIICSVRWRH